MPLKTKYHDHNGKEKKTYTGKNIRVSDESYDLVNKHITKTGGKIGKFYELAAEEKLSKNTKTK
jgi:hypothetical protein